MKLKEDLSDIRALMYELLEDIENIPSACMEERDKAQFEVNLLQESFLNLKKFIEGRQKILRCSIDRGVQDCGQRRPAWYEELNY